MATTTTPIITTMTMSDLRGKSQSRIETGVEFNEFQPRNSIPMSSTVHRGSEDQEPTGSHDTGNEHSIQDISFSVYGFVSSEFMLRLGQEDIRYLEDQMCLRVPRHNLMDEMIMQYFRHVQPLLPIFHESTFWKTYHCTKTSPTRGYTRHISLFVLQAMLFASCSFLPNIKLRHLGFHSVRHARRCLYRRSRLLYLLETDINQISLAQGCLLLSLWCPQDNSQEINTWWLMAGVQHARVAQSHHYRSQKSQKSLDRAELKRLWWCCILRDRVLALCLRRPVQLTHENFNFAIDKLTVAEILGEEKDDGVYERGLRRTLSNFTISMCDLCDILSDVLSFIFPFSTPTFTLPEQLPRLLTRSEQLRQTVNTWYRGMEHYLALIGEQERSNLSLILFSQILEIYF